MASDIGAAFRDAESWRSARAPQPDGRGDHGPPPDAADEENA